MHASLLLLLLPSLVSAAIFPSGSKVKMIDHSGFTKAMKQNETSIVAFVAPWCGYCQRMAPEYSKAAQGLDPLVPLYAVDCDEEKNKRLCGEQGVKGFPTVKLFPRGSQLPPQTFESNDRTASNFFYWASKKVPNNVKKITDVEDVDVWVSKNSKKPKALLLTPDKSTPLLWKVLSNKYRDSIAFGAMKDKNGKAAGALGFGKGGKEGKSVVVVYEGGKGGVYQGKLKKEPLSKFFDSLLSDVESASTLLSYPPSPSPSSSKPEAQTEVPSEPETAADPEPLKESVVESVGEGEGEVPEPEAGQRAKDEL
ncbi:hypothetical protein JAAARDRAFT_54832 [Jaapia argillacea MUCL 33604]|uniref:Thioredoxin domain-containing protein n=1 Tax=Jaapia argillacea MUCL 33604 TaxID=933084 RepID=A0A067QDB0_9AGAM|nr:hypothetical protein JAAARDRAFT_54832 [Jaapia argillacea MUCL 33604]